MSLTVSTPVKILALVGMLGALGGFLLPKAFGLLGRETGFPQAAFLALLLLTVGSLAWLQLAIRALRSREVKAAGTEPSRIHSPAPMDGPVLSPVEN